MEWSTTTSRWTAAGSRPSPLHSTTRRLISSAARSFRVREGNARLWLGNPVRALVIGWAEMGESIQQLRKPSRTAMLMGGNAVVRRFGPRRGLAPTQTDLGRTSEGRLLSCEDEDMFARLLAIGARGFYRPDLDHPSLRSARTDDETLLPPLVFLAGSVARRDRRRRPTASHICSASPAILSARPSRRHRFRATALRTARSCAHLQ